jgi:hypothetical protein
MEKLCFKKREEVMVLKNLLQVTFISLGFVGWGILGKYSQAQSCWVSILVTVATICTLLAIYSTRMLSDVPSMKAVVILAGAGLINGFSVWLYTARVTDPAMSESQVAAFITMVYIAMIVMTPVLNLAINRVIPTIDHGIGYGLALGAVYYLSK